MRFLIAEDDFGSRRLLESMLRAYGSVDVVFDGAEAEEAFRVAWQENDPYSAIFLDIMMPNVDGQAALRSIRSYEQEIGIRPSDEVRVIMTTALGDPKNVVEAYHKGGATSYLVKPIDKGKLKHELESLGLIGAG